MIRVAIGCPKRGFGFVQDFWTKHYRRDGTWAPQSHDGLHLDQRARSKSTLGVGCCWGPRQARTASLGPAWRSSQRCSPAAILQYLRLIPPQKVCPAPESSATHVISRWTTLFVQSRRRLCMYQTKSCRLRAPRPSRFIKLLHSSSHCLHVDPWRSYIVPPYTQSRLSSLNPNRHCFDVMSSTPHMPLDPSCCKNRPAPKANA
ncbi:hypothetical protein BCR34DRAFT_359523 [Clohesyomyces aquaticus]|uniref:Uncharacterized protein n=1 Tax=Clohesyomyces aquaticus TaxID=1231657 RepID=A0A1Y2A6G7_9PLEO|nr:hypothetical protein BCR34DRAFT_359523 [Clohesyomyces aquaticus]